MRRRRSTANTLIFGLKTRVSGFVFDPTAWGVKVFTAIKDCDLSRPDPQLSRMVAEGEVRILLYGHYRIVYLKTFEKTIVFLGVFHGALDIERYLS